MITAILLNGPSVGRRIEIPEGMVEIHIPIIESISVQWQVESDPSFLPGMKYEVYRRRGPLEPDGIAYFWHEPEKTNPPAQKEEAG